ncbi:hypothetical protein [Adlercreutzia caecimuris]|uniref:hypothetical protein n=2 Tax=Adlercreutzia caecimuris TaxID=671266 RepID=UPI001C3EF8B8|nr:hypothetical protein [Adlercreutzia caecimuris]
MFNLLKSDMYRLVHGKMLWVVTAIVVAASVFVVAMMHAVSSPEFLSMTASAVDMTVTAGDDEGARGAASGDETEGPAAASVAAAAEVVEDVAENAAEAEKGAASGSASAELWASVAEDPQALSEADFEGVSREMRTFTTPADMLGDSVVSGGMLTLIVALVAALFCAQDFTTRFARNLVMDRRGRMRYYGGKIVLVGVLAAFFLAVVSLTSVTSFAVAGFTYEAVNSLTDLLVFFGLTWLVIFAYGCSAAVIVWISRSAGAGVAWAIVVCSGFLGAAVGQVLLSLAVVAPWLGALEPWLLSSCVQDLGAFAGALLGTPAAAPLTMVPVAVQVLIAGAVAAGLCGALALGVLRKRDL